MTAPSPPAAVALAGLFAAGHRRALAPGQALFRQGDPADRLFLIERGRLRMVRRLASGEAVPVHTGRTGELFAEGSLFAAVYHCDGLAVEAAAVVSCAKADVSAALAASPPLALELLERLTRQLHAARTLVELRGVRSAEGRVLRHLLLRADATDTVAFEGRLLDAAAELGLTHEAYYRALAALERRGAIAALERRGAIRRGPRRVRLLRPTHPLPAEAPA